MFLGPKITTVFASRWKALAWSCGVLLTAYCSIPSDDGDGTKGATATPAGARAAADSHVSPWAITSPTPTPKPTPSQ